MASAYAAADLVISRAGAGSISEFCLLNKPVILVPSPNVAEGHHKIDFKIIDKNVASFLFWIGCVFDQGFGAGRT